MRLVKHSARTLRKPCYCHGETGHYLAHDLDNPTDKYGDQIILPCAECGATGRLTVINAGEVTGPIKPGDPVPNEYWHDPKAGRNGNPPDHTPTPAKMPQKAPDHAQAPAKQPAATAEAAKAISNSGADPQQALALLQQLLAPQVDRAEIEEIIKAQLRDTVFPTKVVLISERDNEEREIPGTAHEMLADIIEDVEMHPATRLNVMMVGPAGSGKSTIAKQAAKALNLKYGEISLNPALTATALLGYMNATGAYVATVFRDLWENGGLFHADEFDNGHPSTMATLNAALACADGDGIAFPDGMITRHGQFRFIASANTYGRGPDRMYVGRQQLDAATLDRFIIEEIGYDHAMEHALALQTGVDNTKGAELIRYVRALRKNAESKKVQVLFTPRASVAACAMIAAGQPLKRVTAKVIRKGISDADWSKVSDGVVPPAL